MINDTSSVDINDFEYDNMKNTKIFLKKKRNISIGKIKSNLNTTKNINNGKWGKDEHKKFLEICLIHGNNWPKVIKYINFIK